MIMEALALLRADRHPERAAVARALNGHVCRCGAYRRILDAVAAAGSPPDRAIPAPRPAPELGASSGRPWDRLAPGQRDYFDVLGPGLVVALGPPTPPPGTWSTAGGAWIHVSPDGRVTAFTGKVEVGQDTRTALGLLVAEELRVPETSVELVMGDTDFCPFDAGTFGSRSMVDAGRALRVAAAATREHLLEMAAEAWGVRDEPLQAGDGAIVQRSAGRSVTYGTLVTGRRQLATASWDQPVTPAGQWRVADHPALNARARPIVTGAKRYVTDLRLPGQLVGRVLRPPSFRATLRSADLAAAAGLPGVVAVHEGSFVGVAAETGALADRALAAVVADWDVPSGPSDADLAAYLRSHPAQGEGWDRGGTDAHGDVEAALRDAAIQLEATYTAAYLAHVPMETRCALADPSGGRMTVWVGTQRPFAVRAGVAQALALGEEQVRVIVPDTGTGFGGKHSPEVAIEAARLARAAGRPVKVRWTSPEEFTAGYVRPAAVIDVRSGAGPDGSLLAWDFLNINAGMPGIGTPYAVANHRIRHQPAASPLWQGSYRGLAATVNHFARESHMDELAHRIGIDPLAFRLGSLTDDRLSTVLAEAARRIGWQAGAPIGGGSGKGLACGVEKDARVAVAAEVAVDREGRLSVVRLVTVFEAGATVHPQGLLHQVEGCAVMGLGGALFEAVQVRNGAVANGSYSGYRVPRFADVPPIEAVPVDRTDLPPSGGGETPIVAVAPAIANAIHFATGRRLRAMPLVPDGAVAGWSG
jgi:nicotinate dehydrogenase subunit B